MIKYLSELMRIISFNPFSGATKETIYSLVPMIILLEFGTFKVRFKVSLGLRVILFVLVGTSPIHLSPQVAMKPMF